MLDYTAQESFSGRCRPSTNRKRINEWRPWTADGGRQTAVGQAFQPARRPPLNEGRGKLCAFVSWWFILFSPRRHEDTKVEKDRQRIGERINEWGTADGGRQTAVGRAFQPVGEGNPSTNGGTNQRIRPRTAGGRHPRRIGFPACQKIASERGARKNFVTLCSWWFILFSPRRHEDTKVEEDRQRIGERINEWGTADGRIDRGPQTADGGRTASL